MSKDKKKNNIFIKILHIIYFLVFLTLVIFIGIFIYIGINIASTDYYYGSSEVEEIKEEDKDLSEVSSFVMYEALKDVKSSNSISITLDETNMNYMLHALAKKLDFSICKVSNMYVSYNVKENNTYYYNLYIPAKVLFFKTSIVGTLEIENTDQFINLKISNLKLGKLDSSSFVVKDIFLKKFMPSFIDSIFSINNIESNISINNDLIIDINLSKESVSNKFSNSLNSINSIMGILYDTLEDSGKINYEFDSLVGANISLDDISNNDNDDLSNEISICKEKMVSLLGQVEDNSQRELIWYYLINGFDYLSDDEVTKLNKFDFSAVGITNIKDYKGIIDRDKETLDFNLSAHDILEIGLGNKKSLEFNIYESFINKEIRQNNSIGTTRLYVSKDNTDISFILLENIYTTLVNNKMYITCVLNINSKLVNINLSLEKTDNNSSLEFKLSNVELGDITIDKEKYGEILKFIKNFAQTSFMNIDSTNLSITFDFSYLYSSNLIDIINEIGFIKSYSVEDKKIILRYSI